MSMVKATGQEGQPFGGKLASMMGGYLGGV